MVAFPPCKINLGLNILRKREDGFHDIDTCFYPVPWTDIVEVIRSENFSFTASGQDIPGSQEENLCIRAYQLLQADYNLGPVSIHLHKIIPTGAGLGGGSADAAYTLSLMNSIFSLGLGIEELSLYAARLGSDCSFFLHNAPMVGSGRGEILTPLSFSLKGKFLVIVKPDVHVSTKDAYDGVAPTPGDLVVSDVLLNYPVHKWPGLLVNDFEITVFKRYPVIQEVKEKLYEMGALYASMSGSGSSVFGIFQHAVQTKKNFPDWVTWSGEAIL